MNPDGRASITFLGHGAERTGPPILLGHLLRGLARGGRFDLAVVTARDGPLIEEYRAAGARARAVSRTREPAEPLSAALRRLGADRSVDVIHHRLRRRTLAGAPAADLVYVNGATPATAALLAALDPRRPTPVVLHVHELDVGLRLTLDAADRAALLGRADHVIATSDAVAELLVSAHGVDPRHLSTCAGFIDVRAVAPLPRDHARSAVGIPEEAVVIGSVGLPDWRKDPEHLLRAVDALRSTHPGLEPWVLWIGGDAGSLDGRHLADEARRLGLGDRFVHAPHATRPDRLLGAVDVFALPAREDALPLAALEAAAAGLPLVAFRTGGTAALCDRGAGIAVDYPDTAAFAAALGELLTDPTRRRRAGADGAALVAAEHDLGIGVARIERVIDEVLVSAAPGTTARRPARTGGSANPGRPRDAAEGAP